jgi:hypothetical protein
MLLWLVLLVLCREIGYNIPKWIANERTDLFHFTALPEPDIGRHHGHSSSTIHFLEMCPVFFHCRTFRVAAFPEVTALKTSRHVSVWRCLRSGGKLQVSLFDSLSSVSGWVVWDLWWTKCHWGAFSYSTSVFSAGFHCTNFSFIIFLDNRPFIVPSLTALNEQFNIRDPGCLCPICICSTGSCWLAGHVYWCQIIKKTQWSPLANYTDLVAKSVPTFADRGCHVVSVTDPYCLILGFLYRSRYFFFQVALHLYWRSWVDPVPDPLLVL